MAALAVSTVAVGCNKEAPAAAAEPQAPAVQKQAVGATTPAAAVVTAPAEEPAEVKGATPAAAKASGEAFDVNLVSKGGYEAGKPGEVEIVLLAKDPFHVNDKYPYKFKLKEAAGLKYPSMVVGKDQVKLEAKRATLVIPFTPDKAGKHTVAGLFLFSVCAEDKCLIERQELSLDIEAK